MSLVFEIAGQRCAADQVCMRGNTLEVAFDQTALGALADAFDAAHEVSVLSMPAMNITYSVQDYRANKDGGCQAIFAVNSSTGRVLH